MPGITELLPHTGSLEASRGLDLWDAPVGAGDGSGVTGFPQGVPGTPIVHGVAGSSEWAPQKLCW